MTYFHTENHGNSKIFSGFLTFVSANICRCWYSDLAHLAFASISKVFLSNPANEVPQRLSFLFYNFFLPFRHSPPMLTLFAPSFFRCD